jgi:hypothetical protein
MKTISCTAPIIEEVAFATLLNPSFANSQEDTLEETMRKTLSNIQLAGHLSYKAEWVGQSNKMPPKTFMGSAAK